MNEREILDQLIIDRRITEEEIAEASSRVLTTEVKALIDMLHARYCNLNHDTGECGWYPERGLLGEELYGKEWERPYHLAWVDLFRHFLASAELIKFIPESVTEEPSGSTDSSSLPS